MLAIALQVRVRKFAPGMSKEWVERLRHGFGRDSDITQIMYPQQVDAGIRRFLETRDRQTREDESISSSVAIKMKQPSFASLNFDAKRKHTRREDFLGEMEKVASWARLLALIEPHYPTEGRPDQSPTPHTTRLRIYLMQQ